MTEPADDLTAIEGHLSHLLRRSRAFMAKAAVAVHPALEPPAYGLLVRIDEAGPQRPSELATYSGVGKPTISRQLAILEKLDLIERTSDEHDARSSLFSLTTDGANRLHVVRTQNRETFRSSLDGWSEDELAQLERSLRKLTDGFGKA